MSKFSYPENLLDPGIDFLSYEIPWIVPESLEFLDNLITKDDIVLDLGSGGSTIYFLRRCKKVYAVETDDKWFNIVQNKVKELNLSEGLVYNHLWFEFISHYIPTIPDNITVATVDTAKRKNRVRIFEKLIELNYRPDIIILDNWAHQKTFRHMANLTKQEFINLYSLQEYEIFDFIYPGWFGEGTRLLVKKSRLN